MRANFALTLFVLLILVDCFQDRALCDENGALLRCKALGANVKDTKYSLQNQCIVFAVPLQHRCSATATVLQCYCNAFAVLLQKMCSRFAVRACDEKAMGRAFFFAEYVLSLSYL